MALTHRVERIQEQVREEVSKMLATEVRDPGVGLVTVTRAQSHRRLCRWRASTGR
jgi:ribosome-binding factor A